MSSINLHPTFRYSQPEEYAFSHDSVFLAREVFEFCRREKLASPRALDLCAGCGIVGLDFLFHARAAGLPLPREFDFLEIQSVYEPHFRKNVETLGAISTRLEFVAQNYADLRASYDLVLCNPPYFRRGQGSLSPSEFKNRCRFFLDSDFTELIRAIARTLTPTGRAFVLLRDLQAHAWNPLEEARKILGDSWLVEKMGDIRGTDWVQIRRRI